MKFSAAVAHASQTDSYNRDCAEREILDAIIDGRIRMRWEDQPVRPRRIQPTCYGGSDPAANELREWPPQDPLFWQRIPIRDDMVFDPFTQRDRVLLLFCSDVLRFWPEKPHVAPPLPGKSGPKGGRPRTLRDGVKALLIGRNVDLSKPDKELANYARKHWNSGICPSDRTIARGIKAAKDAPPQG